jgi:hypothetical protein
MAWHGMAKAGVGSISVAEHKPAIWHDASTGFMGVAYGRLMPLITSQIVPCSNRTLIALLTSQPVPCSFDSPVNPCPALKPQA